MNTTADDYFSWLQLNRKHWIGQQFMCDVTVLRLYDLVSDRPHCVVDEHVCLRQKINTLSFWFSSLRQTLTLKSELLMELKQPSLQAKSSLWTCQDVAAFCFSNNVSSQGSPVHLEVEMCPDRAGQAYAISRVQWLTHQGVCCVLALHEGLCLPVFKASPVKGIAYHHGRAAIYPYQKAVSHSKMN